MFRVWVFPALALVGGALWGVPRLVMRAPVRRAALEADQAEGPAAHHDGRVRPVEEGVAVVQPRDALGQRDGQAPHHRPLSAAVVDPHRAARMGVRGREWVMEQWRWDTLAARLGELLTPRPPAGGATP